MEGPAALSDAEGGARRAQLLALARADEQPSTISEKSDLVAVAAAVGSSGHRKRSRPAERACQVDEVMQDVVEMRAAACARSVEAFSGRAMAGHPPKAGLLQNAGAAGDTPGGKIVG